MNDLPMPFCDEHRPDFASAEFQGEPRLTLSQRAQGAIKAPGYWDKREGVMPSHTSRRFEMAMWRVQLEIEPIIEADANNPFHKSKYATLGHILSRIRPILRRHRFVIKQGAGKVFAHGKEVRYFLPVFMEISHAPSGESERQMIEIPLVKVDPQAVGIAITYGRRYLLQSYFGIASMDDDAASAVAKRLDKDDEAEAAAGIIEKIKQCATPDELKKWARMNRESLQALSDATVEKLRLAYEERMRELDEPELDLERAAIAAATEPKAVAKPLNGRGSDRRTPRAELAARLAGPLQPGGSA